MEFWCDCRNERTVSWVKSMEKAEYESCRISELKKAELSVSEESSVLLVTSSESAIYGTAFLRNQSAHRTV